MNTIKTLATDQTPEILFDLEKAVISITGKSYPENVPEIYKELLDTTEKYCLAPKQNTTVNFNWLYYNTATSKIIIKILLMLRQADTNLQVNWYCEKDFSMMIEKANTIRDIMAIEINVLEPPALN